MTPCKICKILSESSLKDISTVCIVCPSCGEYNVTEDFFNTFDVNFDPSEISAIKGWLYENQKTNLNEYLINKIKNIRIPVYEKAKKLMTLISERTSFPRQQITINKDHTQPQFLKILSRCWIYDLIEFRYLIEDYLAHLGYIEIMGKNSPVYYIKITPS